MLPADHCFPTADLEYVGEWLTVISEYLCFHQFGSDNVVLLTSLNFIEA